MCGEPYGDRTSDPGHSSCFACRKTEVFKRAQDGMPMKLSAVLAEGVGVPTPNPMVTFEFEGSFNQIPYLPLAAALRFIHDDERAAAPQYDIVEHRRRDGDTISIGVHLWVWPNRRSVTPTRIWIDPDGEVSLSEDVDWLDDSEWPDHIK